MTRKTMRLSLIVAMGLALSVVAGSVAAEEIDRQFQETFEVQPGMKLALEHGDGDVDISSWSEDTLAVEVRYRARASNIGWSKNTDFTVYFRQEGDTIHVIGREPKRLTIGISSYREYEYTYTVKAPSYLELNLEGEDGDVEIADWQGSIVVRLEDGDVTLSDIDAPRTGVILEDGDLTIEGIKGEIDLDCEDGDVVLDLDREVSARFELETEDGDIKVSASDVAELEKNRRHVSGRLGDGAGAIYVRTGDGSVTLRQ